MRKSCGRGGWWNEDGEASAAEKSVKNAVARGSQGSGAAGRSGKSAHGVDPVNGGKIYLH